MMPCEVITSHSEAGKVIPVKIRVREGDEYRVVTIKSCIELTQSQRKDIKRYRCKIVVNDAIRECELTFYKDMTKWVLDKIK